MGQKNGKWIKENYDELEKKYPDMWVAVDNGQVLAVSEDFDKVLETVRDKHQDVEDYLNIQQIRTNPWSCRPWRKH